LNFHSIIPFGKFFQKNELPRVCLKCQHFLTQRVTLTPILSPKLKYFDLKCLKYNWWNVSKYFHWKCSQNFFSVNNFGFLISIFFVFENSAYLRLDYLSVEWEWERERVFEVKIWLTDLRAVGWALEHNCQS